MILTTHALVGAVIGKYVHNPMALAVLLIPFHYALDILRHGEYINKKSTFKNTAWKVILDLFTSLIIILLALYFKKFNLNTITFIFIGAFISMFPDLLTVLYWKFNSKFLGKIFKFHKFVHRRFKEDSQERKWTLRNATNDIWISLLAIIFLFI